MQHRFPFGLVTVTLRQSCLIC